MAQAVQDMDAFDVMPIQMDMATALRRSTRHGGLRVSRRPTHRSARRESRRSRAHTLEAQSSRHMSLRRLISRLKHRMRGRRYVYLVYRAFTVIF